MSETVISDEARKVVAKDANKAEEINLTEEIKQAEDIQQAETQMSGQTRTPAELENAGTKDGFQTQAVGHVPTPGSNTGKGGKK